MFCAEELCCCESILAFGAKKSGSTKTYVSMHGCKSAILSMFVKVLLVKKLGTVSWVSTYLSKLYECDKQAHVYFLSFSKDFYRGASHKAPSSYSVDYLLRL